MKHYAITAGIAALVVVAYHKGMLDFLVGEGAIDAKAVRKTKA